MSMVEVRIFQIHRSVDDRFWQFVIPNSIGNRNANALRFPPARERRHSFNPSLIAESIAFNISKNGASTTLRLTY